MENITKEEVIMFLKQEAKKFLILSKEWDAKMITSDIDLDIAIAGEESWIAERNAEKIIDIIKILKGK